MQCWVKYFIKIFKIQIQILNEKKYFKYKYKYLKVFKIQIVLKKYLKY